MQRLDPHITLSLLQVLNDYLTFFVVDYNYLKAYGETANASTIRAF